VSDPVPWPKSFPNVFQMTTVSKMKSHRDYQAAKSGDAIAAANVLGQRHPNAIVVPVHAQEASGKNQLPSLFARMIGELAGLSVDTEIVQSNDANDPAGTNQLSISIDVQVRLGSIGLLCGFGCG